MCASCSPVEIISVYFYFVCPHHVCDKSSKKTQRTFMREFSGFYKFCRLCEKRIINSRSRANTRTNSIDSSNSINSVNSVSERVTRSRTNSIDSGVVIPAKKRPASRPPSRALVAIIENTASIETPNEYEFVIDLSDTLVDANSGGDDGHVLMQISMCVMSHLLAIISVRV